MATYKKVRQFVLVDGNSSRKAAAHFAVGRNSVRKILENPIPKKRKTPINIQHPVIGKFKCLIDQYLEINKSCHYKQKLTGKRILELLKNEHGYEGSIRTVIPIIINNYHILISFCILSLEVVSYDNRLERQFFYFI